MQTGGGGRGEPPTGLSHSITTDCGGEKQFSGSAAAV